MIDPLFWLGLSILLVAVSLTAVLVTAIPALQELARASRSAENLFDTLAKELPPTLKAIQNTSLEITDLTDNVSEGVKTASQVVKQVDQNLDTAKKQAENIQISTRSLLVGVKAAWRSFTDQKPVRRQTESLQMSEQLELTWGEQEVIQQNQERSKTGLYRANNSYSETMNWENDIYDE